MKKSMVHCTSVNCKLNKLLCFFQRINLSDIQQAQIVFLTAVDARAMAGLQVEIDDGKTVGEAIHQRKQARRKAVDARKREQIQHDFRRSAHNRQPVVLLGEPGAALDLPCKERIGVYLNARKQQGHIIVIATHEEREIALCDRILLLKNGFLNPVEYGGDIHRLVGMLNAG